MTLTAPAPALPLFGTVAYEPTLEPPGTLLDGAVVVEGDVPAVDGRDAARESSPPSARERVSGTDRRLRVSVPPEGQMRRERERAIAARRRAELVVRTALEVLDGRRPVRQLAPYATPQVLRYVNAGVPRRGHTRAAGASLRSLHMSLPARTAAEVAAVCRFGAKVRALAARLELTGQGEWRCVALRVI
ncbi:Rv3235 family protein [Pseudonocardia kujensis]|uniref:Rv3235 family protein n=1 Tax=Pseudonocardia kujensis TaxID=1128675 RepID=UPI001E4DF9D8|nr:Rv3235 family protein [Pseudonocardia kujensis]MCE0766427.1 Rv3235 family protein [Pseudonocardia kujensis]